MKEMHYEPKEYSIAFRVFEELDSIQKDTIDSLLKGAFFGDTRDKEIFKQYLDDSRDYIGNVLYSMYSNLYLNCINTKIKQYRLFDED